MNRRLFGETAETVPAANAALSLRDNFAWTFAGNVVYAACQWGMLVVLAKAGTAAMVGQFALATSIATPVIQFSNLSLRSIQATDARRRFAFGDYLGLRLAMTLLALIVISGIAVTGGFRWETASVIVIIGLAKSFEAISDVFYGFHQQQERMNRIAKSMMMRGIGSLLAISIGTAVTGSILVGVTCMAGMWLVLLLVFDARGNRASVSSAVDADRTVSPERPRSAGAHPLWHGPTMARLAWLALPLGLVLALSSLTTSVPRYFILPAAGEAELGIFAAVAALMAAGDTVATAFGQSASPRLAKLYRNGDRPAFGRLLVRLTAVNGGVGLAGVLPAVIAGPLILRLVYGPEYAAYADIFVLMMMVGAVTFVGDAFGVAITSMHHFRVQVLIQICKVAILLTSCFLLVERFGLIGAAAAIMVSQVFSAVCFAGVTLFRLARDGQFATLPDAIS